VSTKSKSLPLTKEEVKAKLCSLVDAGLHYNAEKTTIIGRTDDDSLMFVAAYWTGDDAAKLVEILETIDNADPS
jgi:hypothetical protein